MPDDEISEDLDQVCLHAPARGWQLECAEADEAWSNAADHCSWLLLYIATGTRNTLISAHSALTTRDPMDSQGVMYPLMYL